MSHTEAGALTGTALGTVAGAIIGGHNGNSEAGAIIGGITGMGLGAMAGSTEDAREERDLALAERDAAIAQASHSSIEAPLTNYDLIRLSQNGVSDQVIVNMIRSRGGSFQLNTNDIIALKQNGVSDSVIVAAQSAPSPKLSPPRVVRPSRPSVVYVEPPPPAAIVIGAGPCWHHRHYHHRSGAHFHFDF
ncbi:MAG: hypothetical protein KDA80_00385 [Planctomycetaceae bacterium]|nr:hypothetical protein [Planctomycetaceae bacterium]